MLNRHGISRNGRGELALVVGRGRRLVTVSEVATALQVDQATAAKKMARWAKEGWLRRVRRGLYIPVPVDAEDPANWSEDPLVLADAVWAPCYFTGWTAANHWGLTEQIFRTTVLKTSRPVRSANARLLDQDFLLAHVAEDRTDWGLRNVWRDDHRIRMADPGRTLVDILDDPRLGGGIRQGAEILASFLDEHDWRTLIEYGERLGNRTVFKRLGHLTEAMELASDDLLNECRRRISSGISLLDPGAAPDGARIARWGLRANVHIGPPEAA